MKKTTLHPVARPFFYWATMGFTTIQLLSCTSIFRRTHAILLRSAVFLLKPGMDRIIETDGKKVDPIVHVMGFMTRQIVLSLSKRKCCEKSIANYQ